MDGHGSLELRPTRLDLAIARCCETKATPNTQRITRIVTLLADEKAVLALAGAVWVASRLVRNGSQRDADQLVGSAIVAGAFPHLIKVIVARRRPDRFVTEPRNGIGKSGSAWNSFPSG